MVALVNRLSFFKKMQTISAVFSWKKNQLSTFQEEF